jgi:hypothetical protein
MAAGVGEAVRHQGVKMRHKQGTNFVDEFRNLDSSSVCSLSTSEKHTMYKWHVHSAIGRGRPLASDFSRVADGIAASLRHFSVSASKTAEGSGKFAPRG